MSKSTRSASTVPRLLCCVVGLILSVATSSRATAQEPTYLGVADEGIVYLFGNRIEAPYTIQVLRDTIWINGLQARPGPAVLQKTPVTPAAESHFRIVNQLLTEIRGVPEGQERAARLASAVASILKDEPTIASYTLEGESLTIKWNDSEIVDVLTLRAQGKNLSKLPGPEYWTNRQAQVAQEWQAALSKGKAVILSRRESYYITSASSLESDLQLIATFGGKLPPRDGWRRRSFPYNELNDFLAPLPIDELAKSSK